MTPIELDSEIPPTWRERLADWLTRLQFAIYSTLAVCLIVLGFLWPRMFIVIPAGHEGVLYQTVAGGTVTNRRLGEGLRIIAPWNKLTIYEVRLQQKTLNFQVLSDEGLTLGVQVAVRFRPREEMLGYLHKDVGENYFERLIKPEIEAHVRRTFGSRPAHDLYATVSDVLQEIAQFPLIGRFEVGSGGVSSRPYVDVQDLKLVTIELPKIVDDSISEKYHQEQLMLAYKYKLEREGKRGRPQAHRGGRYS